MPAVLMAWGANQYGQLALEDWPISEQCETPQSCSLDGLPDGILTKVQQICGGGGHTLLLDKDGSVWACGQNNKGQCGVPVNSELKVARPWVNVSFGSNRIIEVAAGWEHSVALDSEGQIFVWGSNSHGQMGSVVERGKWSFSPLKLAENAQSVSAGLRQTTWTSKQGSISCCSSLGQINIEVPPILKPLQVACGQKNNFVLMGTNETDNLSGNVFCWGDNKFWQLAVNPSESPKSESLIRAEGLKDHELVSVKSGWSHGAAISTAGQVICWGRSNYGQLGSQELTGQHQNLWPALSDESGVQTKAVQLALGSEHTIALTESGDVWTCGWNEHGNCGNGSLEDQFNPNVILRNAKLIGCGAAHSFALLENS